MQADSMMMMGMDDMSAGQADILPVLSGSHKAAIIVQMILSTGGTLPLTSLSSQGQTRLMRDFSDLGRVDRSTLSAVVAELERELEDQGLKFPRSIAAALETLESHVSPELVKGLRDELGVLDPTPPWEAITGLSTDKLMELIGDEDPKVAAIILSKLEPEQASEIVEKLPQEQASSLTLAVQGTETTSPEMLTRIGRYLRSSLPEEPPKAFSDEPSLRVANMLNSTSPGRRDELLASLGETDPDFAAAVRANIFTFGDIATRISATDVAKLIRGVPQDELVTALAFCKETEKQSCDFILDNISQRMADGLREEVNDLGEVNDKLGEEAMGKITSAVRGLADLGEVTILPPADQVDAEE